MLRVYSTTIFCCSILLGKLQSPTGTLPRPAKLGEKTGAKIKLLFKGSSSFPLEISFAMLFRKDRKSLLCSHVLPFWARDLIPLRLAQIFNFRKLDALNEFLWRENYDAQSNYKGYRPKYISLRSFFVSILRTGLLNFDKSDWRMRLSPIGAA